MTKKTTDLVADINEKSKPTCIRKRSLTVGDLYKKKVDSDKVYMFTGRRTAPPSEYTSILFIDYYGVHVVGFNSIVVQGDVKEGSDGAVVSFKDDDVYLVGKARIDLDFF